MAKRRKVKEKTGRELFRDVHRSLIALEEWLDELETYLVERRLLEEDK